VEADLKVEGLNVEGRPEVKVGLYGRAQQTEVVRSALLGSPLYGPAEAGLYERSG
jgi:hypothetical protein